MPTALAPRTPAPRAAITALPPYVPGRRASSELTAALAANESHFPPLPGVAAGLDAALRRVNRYPDATAADLRAAIAARHGVAVDGVVVGPGSLGVLQQIVTAMCEPGDEIVFAWRSFEAYPLVAAVAGARAVTVPLLADDAHDLDGMAAAVGERTRIVLLCSPNNPTGVALTHDAVERFLRRVPAHVLVVLDEAYAEFVTDPAAVQGPALLRRHPNVCVLRTFSKAYGLAGLRVGYALADPAVADGLRRAGLPFAVSSVGQQAALACLDAGAELDERVAAVAGERDRVEAAVRAHGWQVPTGQANFLWLRVDEGQRTELVDAFHAADILVRGYPDAGVRVTLADPATNDRVLAVLAAPGLRRSR